MKIRFTQDVSLKDDPPVEFKAGEVYDLNDRSADRWIRRNLAVAVDDAPEAAAVVPEETADSPDAKPKRKAAK